MARARPARLFGGFRAYWVRGHPNGEKDDGDKKSKAKHCPKSGLRISQPRCAGVCEWVLEIMQLWAAARAIVIRG